MRLVTFICSINENGYKSFKMADKPWADARSAFVAAHDLIEHSPDDSGQVQEELMALGAGLWLRGVVNNFGDDDFSRCRAIYNIKNDIVGVFIDFPKQILSMPKMKNSIGELPGNYKKEFKRMYKSMREWDQNVPKRVAFNMLRWAAYGLLKALERYKNPQILQMYDDLHRNFKFSPPFNGVLDVLIDYDTCQFDTQFIEIPSLMMY